MQKLPSQIVGNIGLYYVSYKLSKLGWNVMPTSRNARGIDIICFSMDGLKMLSIQVKTLSKKNPVPLGKNLEHIMADYWVIVNNVSTDTPNAYILKPDEIKSLAHRGEKDGRVSFWLQPKDYAVDVYHEKWDRIDEGRNLNKKWR